MSVLTYIYLLSILAAFLSSVIASGRGLSRELRMFSWLLGLTLAVEITAAMLAHVVRRSNNWVYNSFTLVEFWVYGYFFSMILAGRWAKRIVLGFLIVFPIFWGVTVLYLFGFKHWNSYVIIVGSFFTVLFCLLYYYQLATAPDRPDLRRLSEFWIATGMLIFYMAALPYFGLLNFLIQYHLEAARDLLIVLQCLDTLMYILITYGYLCRTLNIKKS
jgi:hypothetical protein